MKTLLKNKFTTIIVPEYNGSFPGVLKHFIDMLPFPQAFQNRFLCFIGIAAGKWGGMRAVEHLQQVFSYRNSFLFPHRVFIDNSFSLLDEKNNIINKETEKRLKKQSLEFISFCKKNKNVI